MNRFHGALVALILVLTACGSAEDSFRDQLADVGFSDETADCLIEELEKRGLSVEDVTDEATEDGMPPGAAFTRSETVLNVAPSSSQSAS